ncbi:Probable methionine--tRNA ligase [Linum perenne]
MDNLSLEDSVPKKLPVPGERNVLITSALPYCNNMPHLGNIIGCVLSADVFARYCRLRGYNTLYICGTDEYGTATETKAMEEKCTPQEICDKYHALHSEVYKWFDIDFDLFGRTSTPQQTEVCHQIFKKLLENNWLDEDTTQQLYCGTCEKFLADRLVEGTCPTEGCTNTGANGDECEVCGKFLNPTELKDPKCKIVFPSCLLGTGEKWTMMKSISVTEYLNYESGKFSKSKGVGVFGNDVKDTKIPVEVWRYYLLTNRPEVSDTLFTWADLQAKLNNELVNNLGNFINRVLSFIAKPQGSGYDSIIPDAPGAESHLLTKQLADKVDKYVDQYLEAMEKVKLKQALKTAMAISSEGNAYLQASRFWTLYKEDKPSCDIVMRTSVGLVHLLASLLHPFMPSFSDKVFKQLNLLPEQVSLCDKKGDIERAKRPWEIIHPGQKIGTPVPLFKELKDEDVEFYRRTYAGSQADRLERAEAANVAAAEAIRSFVPADGKKQQSKKPKDHHDTKTITSLDIRIGLITKVQKHPDAESLYIEEIDVGEGQPRTIVSGLVKHVPLDELQNRKVCVLCNLKPATIRGVKSHGMVLAVSNADQTKIELVDPPASAAVGERITFNAEVVLDPKLEPSLISKKAWDTFQVDMHTDEELVARYKDAPFATSAGVCKVASICNGSIS